MATIEKSQKVDWSKYTSGIPTPPPPASDPTQTLLPTRSPLLRFPTPYIPGIFPSSDNLLGYHLGGMMPQYRIPVPSQASAQGAGGTTNTSVIASSSSSTSTNNP